MESGPEGTGNPVCSHTIRRLAAAALALVAVIITASAFLRLGQAGLGCPDWPACYGLLEANATRLNQALPATLVRAVHRVAALSAAALVLALGWQVMARRPRRRTEVTLVLLLLMVLAFLAVIGRWTGSSRIPAVAVGNILGGSALLALLGFLWCMQRPASMAAPRPALAALAWISLAVFALQALLGALVGAKYAALSCDAWIACPGATVEHVWSTFDPFSELVFEAGGVKRSAGLATLQLAHHCGALAVLALSLALAGALVRSAASRPLGIMVMACAGVQVVLGMAAILSGHAFAISVAHNLGAGMLLLALVAAAHACSRGSLHRSIAGLA